jgi:hypothetical protein
MLIRAKRRRSCWECLGIRLDENLDGLFARINLDTNGRVAEIDLVASPVRSA